MADQGFRLVRKGRRGCDALTKAGEPCRAFVSVQDADGCLWCDQHIPDDVRRAMIRALKDSSPGCGGLPEAPPPDESL